MENRLFLFQGPAGPFDKALPARYRCNARRASSEASKLSTGLFSGRSMPLFPLIYPWRFRQPPAKSEFPYK